ncbi:chromo domain-like protein, partial [Blyttiomyces helicus]
MATKTEEPAFSENETVLCFHGPLMYEAKILKIEYRKSEDSPDVLTPYYRVHYRGWKKNWDEWVPESRVLKFTDENQKQQSEIEASLSPTKTKPSGKAGGDKRKMSVGGPKKKRKESVR